MIQGRDFKVSGNSKQRRKAIRKFKRGNAPFFELRPSRFRKENKNFGSFEIWQKEIEFG